MHSKPTTIERNLGPWTATPGGQDDQHWYDIRSAANDPYPRPDGSVGAFSQSIAMVYSSEGRGAANARLMAAAPELLALLEQAVKYLDFDTLGDKPQQIFDATLQLLAKIDGSEADGPLDSRGPNQDEPKSAREAIDRLPRDADGFAHFAPPAHQPMGAIGATGATSEPFAPNPDEEYRKDFVAPSAPTKTRRDFADDLFDYALGLNRAYAATLRRIDEMGNDE